MAKNYDKEVKGLKKTLEESGYELTYDNSLRVDRHLLFRRKGYTVEIKFDYDQS